MSELLVNTIKKADGTGSLSVPAESGTVVVKDGSNDVTLNNITATGVYLGGTGAANHLDDYEEGTFTPTFGGSSSDGTLSYDHQIGSYTKIGNKVTCWMRVKASSTVTGGGGTLEIKGLPFTSANLTNLGWFGHASIGYFDGLSSYGTSTTFLLLLGPQTNQTVLRLHTFNNAGGAGTVPTQAEITANTDFYVGCSYTVA